MKEIDLNKLFKTPYPQGSGFYSMEDGRQIIKFGGKIGFILKYKENDNTNVIVSLCLLKNEKEPENKITKDDILIEDICILHFDNVKSIDATIKTLYKAKCILLSKEENKN